jgi:hypothetical protein
MMVLMPAMVGCADVEVVLRCPASVLGMRRDMRWVAGRIDRSTSLKLELSLRSACLGCRGEGARTCAWRDLATGGSFVPHRCLPTSPPPPQTQLGTSSSAVHDPNLSFRLQSSSDAANRSTFAVQHPTKPATFSLGSPCSETTTTTIR